MAAALAGAISAGCTRSLSPGAVSHGVHKSDNLTASALEMDRLVDQMRVLTDRDQDGRLSAEEIGLDPRQFSIFDRDHSGFIESTEWNAEISLDEAAQAAPAFKPMIQLVHTQLSKSRSAQILRPHPINQPLDWLSPARLQKVADTDHNGLVSEKEFAHYYATMGASAIGATGFGTRIGRAMLGGYLSLVSRLALHRATHPNRKKVKETPALFGLPFENVAFQTEDGLTLRGWFIPARKPTEHTVIAYHGISDTRSTFVRQGQVAALNPYVNQLVMDLRNHGESEGDITTFGLHEGLDVSAAVRYLASRGIRSVIVFGISLGGATAIRGAALNPAIKGVIDDCAFATVQQAFSGFISLLFIPSPVLAAAAALERAKREWGLDLRVTEPIRQIAQVVPRPMLFIHGERDLNVPPENSDVLFTAAGSASDKTLWFAPGAGHANSAVVQKEAYERHLVSFVTRVFQLETGHPALPAQISTLSRIGR